MAYGSRAPFGADRLVRPGDFDERLDQVGAKASLVQRHEQPTPHVEWVATAVQDDSLALAREALQRAFM